MRRGNYDKFPYVEARDGEEACVAGWENIGLRLREAISARGGRRTILAVECYPGVNVEQIRCALSQALRPALVVDSAEAMLTPDRVDDLVQPFVGDDPVFGFLSGLTLGQFLDPEKLTILAERVAAAEHGVVLVVGVGAALVAPADIVVYADLTRREAQLRFRRNESGNLGADNTAVSAALQYKRAFFVDWRVADRHKHDLIARWDFVLETNTPENPRMAEGAAVLRALEDCARRPFRVVPFFDPAPWGGQWMKQVCDLDRGEPNFGWSFDGVPEENSLIFGFGPHRFEIPSLNLVFHQPHALLGEAVHARFGDEFPIRFDFLDTMGGGNLSFQVHPLTEYIQRTFGMHYTQDESYYLLDAGDDAAVYLGLRPGIDAEAMVRDLESAQAGGPPFDADAYANRWPARKHDHFLIPAGTVHCSGANAMVLEISATPYIFTFKLWDWARMGLDGKPRPIHIEHGKKAIQWDRDTEWVRANLINAVVPMAEGDGWREERTGLHEREFIETRRHWFTKATPHHTCGGVNMLNLVEGEEAVVESPCNDFAPFVVHYAETFIIPAAVGPYTVRPHGPSEGQLCATLKASVRT